MIDWINIEASDGDTYNGRITFNGNTLPNIAKATIVMEPDSLVEARLHVYATLSDIKAVGRMFPVWEHIDMHPKDTTECLFLLESGKKFVGTIKEVGQATHFIPLTWLDSNDLPD